MELRDLKSLSRGKSSKLKKEFSAFVLKRKNFTTLTEAPVDHLSTVERKKKAVDKVKEVLPVTPEKKAAVLSTVLESPTTRQTLALKGLVSSEEAKIEADVNSAIVADARNLIQTIKDGRSKDYRAAMQCCVSLLCGDTVSKNKMQKAVAETLTINRERIRSRIKHCKHVLSDTSEGWTVVKRKRRNDATPEEHLKLACDFLG